MFLLADLLTGLVLLIALAGFVLWIMTTSGCGGIVRRDAPRENLVPPLRPALRRRASGISDARRPGDLLRVR